MKPRLPARVLLAAAFAVGGAAAQSPLTEDEARYLGAYVFERQAEVFRRFCAADAESSAELEAGLARFRAGNPGFADALQTPPERAEVAAGVQAFDTRFEAIAVAMHDVLATRTPREQCADIALRLGSMQFETMMAEATGGITEAVTASVP